MGEDHDRHGDPDRDGRRGPACIPNQEAAFAGHGDNPFLQVADDASTNSRFTPVSPNWANVESSAVLQDMLVKIFTGQSSIDDATQEASQAITDTLNQ